MAGILPIGAPGAPPPAPPIFRFVGGPAPHDTWVIGMPAVPELEVLIDEPFAAWARGWVWTPHPAAPAQPTHLRCPYKFVEAVLHGCQRSEDDALLESGSFSRYDRPSQLSEVLLALTETGKLLMTTPLHDMRLILMACLGAAKNSRNDPRLMLTLAKTAQVQPAPANALLASRWPLLVKTRHLAPSASNNLINEMLMYWRCPERFTQAARVLGTSAFAILFESSRVRVETETPPLAAYLVVAAANFDTISENVGEELASLEVQPELIKFPLTLATVIKDIKWSHQYCLGLTPSVRQSAFVIRLPDMLIHFHECCSVFTDNSGVTSFGLRPFVQQLVQAHFSAAQDPFSVETFRELETRVAAVNQQMRLDASPPTSIAGVVLWHERYLTRLATAVKLEQRQNSTSVNSSSRVAGVQSQEFKCIAPIIEAAAAATVSPARNEQTTQTVMRSECKILIMFMWELVGGVAGFQVFNTLSLCRGHLDSYLGWCLSVDSTGHVPYCARGKVVPQWAVKATAKGRWFPADGLNLYNLCKAWEQMIAHRQWSEIPVEDWFLDNHVNRVFQKFGNRYFEGIGRSGVGRGSFLWVCDQGIELLDSKHARSCSPKEVTDLVQWWFRAALTEAGDAFADATRQDTDFSKPLRNEFLTDTGTGCISKLALRLKSLDKWEEFAENMPETVASLLSSAAVHNGGAAHISVGSPSLGHDPVVDFLRPSKRQKPTGSHTPCCP